MSFEALNQGGEKRGEGLIKKIFSRFQAGKSAEDRPITPPPFRKGLGGYEKTLLGEIERLEKENELLRRENEQLKKEQSDPELLSEDVVFINENLLLGCLVSGDKKVPAIKKDGKWRPVSKDYKVNMSGGGIEQYYWDDKKYKWVLND